jgi:hypothetical protein
MKTMPNKARNTQSPAHLDEIAVGCAIDGSHAHPDDFSMQVIQYAEMFGFKPDASLVVAMGLRSTGMGEDICTPEGLGRISESLMEGSDEAVTWLNEHVSSEPFVFYVHESDLFLGHEDDDV